ncbi:MAG: flavodoxin family protein [Elusimicrobia bacterium]|nr:flavodoxin family protein [Elusimicrobiota bacterium]
MTAKILILNGSPKINGNTAKLIDWFVEGLKTKGAEVEIINTAFLKYKASGCLSCRKCQKYKEYECSIDDDAKPVLKKMAKADIIVMATPLYFYGPSAQLKHIFDRMFSLYKWDNEADTMETPLKGKTLVLIASAYEDVGLDALEKPFKLTADYTPMKFASLLIPNAGVSGNIKNIPGIREKTIEFAKSLA